MAYEVLSKGNVDNLAGNAGQKRRIRPFDWVALASLTAMLVIFIFAGRFTREFSVDVAKVTREYPFQIDTRLKTSGHVVTDHVIAVMPKTMGQVVEILVKEGDPVIKGQVVARLESTDAELLKDKLDADVRLAHANLEQAAIGYGEARTEHERSKELYQEGSLSESGYQSSLALLRKAKSAVNVAEATVKAQTAALHGAEVALGYTQVKAPVDGVVLKKIAHVGDTVSPLDLSGQTVPGIISLAEFSSLRVEGEVPEYEIDSIKTGDPCVVTIEALKKTLRGEVEAILPPAGEDAKNAMVRIVFIDHAPGLRPEMTADIAFLTRPLSSDETRPITVVDRKALVAADGGHTVFLVRGGHAVEKRVSIGEQYKERVEIRKGLSAGDTVILNPPDELKKGAKVVPKRI